MTSRNLSTWIHLDLHLLGWSDLGVATLVKCVAQQLPKNLFILVEELRIDKEIQPG